MEILHAQFFQTSLIRAFRSAKPFMHFSGMNVDHCKGTKEGDGWRLLLNALRDNPDTEYFGRDRVVYSQNLNDPLQREFCGMIMSLL